MSPVTGMVPAVNIDCFEILSLSEGIKCHVSNEHRNPILVSGSTLEPGNLVLFWCFA
jgi:hypothetical protein